jgi:hypothetical protein
MISETWLAARLGIEPRRLSAARRSGDVLAVRSPDAREWLYPTWQFDGSGGVRGGVARVLASAKERGFDGAALCRFLGRRVGLVDGRRYLDLLLEGRTDDVVSALARA